MKRTLLALAVLLFVIPAVALEPSPAFRLGEDLEVVELQDRLWLHRSHVPMNGKPVWSNGLILVAGDGILVVDTAWTEEQTDRLADWIEKQFDAPVLGWIVTHFHADRAGGIRTVHGRGIRTYGSTRTAELAVKDGDPAPTDPFELQATLSAGTESLEAFYPGAGHSPDNIVVWFPERRVLYGGCLIKNASSKSIGYTGDALLGEWPETLDRVMDRYPDPRLIIPGHGRAGGLELIENTRRLIREAQAPPR